MTPARCSAPPHEQGDCWRACIASILNLPADEVPNFGHLAGDDWDEMYRLARPWLGGRGIGLFRTYCSAGWAMDKLLEVFSEQNTDIPLIVSGKSGRNPREGHAVVAMNGRIVHDPSGAGVCGPMPCLCGTAECDGNGYWWIDVLAFGAESRLTA